MLTHPKPSALAHQRSAESEPVVEALPRERRVSGMILILVQLAPGMVWRCAVCGLLGVSGESSGFDDSVFFCDWSAA